MDGYHYCLALLSVRIASAINFCRYQILLLGERGGTVIARADHRMEMWVKTLYEFFPLVCGVQVFYCTRI